LSPTDAFAKLQIAAGDLSEDEFKSYFTFEEGTFEDNIGTVDDYFDNIQQEGFEKKT
jgi:hypothetical protein